MSLTKIDVSKYSLQLVNPEVAKRLIVKNHYSHTWTSCRYAFGLYDMSKVVKKGFSLIKQGTLVGVAVYGYPVGRQTVNSIVPGLSGHAVLELTRLWLEDDEPKNTESFFIGRTFDWLRKNTKIKVLISYSDPMHGHVGTIYQATNWLYQGNETMLIKGYLHKINGEKLHPRTCVAKYGTIKEKVLLQIDPNYERIVMKKKHRYLYILHKRDRKQIIKTLKHPILPYPKNNSTSEW